MAQRGHRGAYMGGHGAQSTDGHAAGPPPRPDRLAVLRQHIVRLADKTPGSQHLPDPEEQLELLSQALKRDLVAYEDAILQITLECTWELPHKLPFYGALLGLLNVADYNFVQRAVASIHSALQAALHKGDPLTLRLGLRILAALAATRVVSCGSVVRVFHALVTDAVAALDTAPTQQARGDAYVYAVLGALPWGGKELALGGGGAVVDLLDLVTTYTEHREHLRLPALQAFHTAPDGTPAADPQDYVEALAAAVQALAQEGTWTIKSVARPHDHFLSRLQSAEPHSVPLLEIPPLPAIPADLLPLAAGHARWAALCAYPPDIPRLRIFPATKTEEGLSAVDVWVVGVLVADVLRAFNGARKECTIFLVNLPLPFRVEYLICELVLSHLLALPHPPARLVFYTVVLVDLCKALPAAFPALVAQAIKHLYARLPVADCNTRMRLTQWMAHHLSNFGFVWSWDEWSPVMALPSWHPQRLFCSGVLEREVRLAYWDKVRETLPDALAPLMPPKPGPAAAPADDQGGGQEAGLAQQLTALIREKKTSKEVSAWLDAAVVPALGVEGALSLVTPTLLAIGSKTLTHMVTMLERYQPLLARLAPNRPAQTKLVAAAATFWAASPQMTSICIDRLMAFRLVSNLAILDWAFSPALLPTLHISDLVWEVLGRALAQTGARVADLAGSLAVAQAEVAAAEAVVASLGAAVGLEAEQAHARQQETVAAAQEALQVKEALHARAQQEQQSLLVAVLDSLALATAQRQTALQAATLPPRNDPLSSTAEPTQGGDEEAGHGEGAQAEAGPAASTPSSDAPDMAAEAGGVHVDEPSAMEVEGGPPAAEGGSSTTEAAEGREEGEAWVACALGQLRAIVRQHAQQLWPLALQHKLEVLTEGRASVEVQKAIYEGLCYMESDSTEGML